MLVKSSILLSEARKGGYAVGAFNVYSGEFIQAVAEAALEEKSPAIIQATWDVIERLGVDYVVKVVEAVALNKPVQIALHLDHGHNLIQVLQCIRAGFTSVMYDGSGLTFEENISSTEEICRIVHGLDVSMEAQVGHIKSSKEKIGGGEMYAGLTNPADAKRFVDATGIDAISISVGNVHGKLDGKAELRMDLIEEIGRLVDSPLVLHGGTGIPDEDVKEAVKLGVSKINIGTVVRNAFKTELRNSLTGDTSIHVNNLLLNSKKAMKEVIKEKIRLFGSSEKTR